MLNRQKILPPASQAQARTFNVFDSLLRQFDTDCDDRISEEDIKNALKRYGAEFPDWRARGAMAANDFDHDGYLDEMTELHAFLIQRFAAAAAAGLGVQIQRSAGAGAAAAVWEEIFALRYADCSS